MSTAPSLEQDVARLLFAFLDGNDRAAFERLVHRLAPTLAQAAQAAVSDQGLLADPKDIAGEWFSAVFIDTRRPVVMPGQPVAQAEQWIHDRAREMTAVIAARPLPGEWGYHDGLNQTPSAGTSTDAPCAPADAEQIYVTNVAFHRLDKLDRTILRSTDVDRMLPADVAERLSLTEDQVIDIMAGARRRLAALCLRPTTKGRQR
ncbi:MAG: hypothetical protein DRQ55_12595 [Planctomycetota bacterium]|nr:MAG: hypothetical protein DRQ55_12595 [Planctomycetota bacterium]